MVDSEAETNEVTDQPVWVLTPRDDRNIDDVSDPWSPWFDKNFGFIIRAESETRAREIAQENAGGETRDNRDEGVWTDPSLAACVPIEEYGGDDEVLMRDFARA